MRAIHFLLLMSICVLGSGCAASMAMKQPDKKDLSVLVPGSHRNLVISELGAPQHNSKSADGINTDVYNFKQGYTDLTKMSRAVGHVGLDLSTAFLWELAGMPIEHGFDGEDVRVEVAYDPQDRAQRIEYFAGAYMRNGGATLPREMKREAPKTALLGDPNFGRNSNIQQASGTNNSNQRFFD